MRSRLPEHPPAEPDGFDAVLRAAKLMDADGRWVGGDATLVQTGDVTDRGPRVRAVMDRLRALQDDTGGFMCFIPLAFHPENTELDHLPGPTGFDDLMTIAVSRLMLDNFDHIKAYWIMITPRIAQTALNMGADCIDGTVVEEKIVHMAGARTPVGADRELSSDRPVTAAARGGRPGRRRRRRSPPARGSGGGSRCGRGRSDG